MSKLPVGILLAAGQSRRFGGNKLLHPVLDGIPMLLHSAKNLVGVLENSIVVINKGLASYTGQLEQLGLQVVINDQAHRGMGTSIACGVKASEAATAWLIALADMPYVKAETIVQISDSLTEGADMVAPMYKQQRGHPVGFSCRYKDELIVLNDDVGARQIIANHQNELELIATQDEGVIIDIDEKLV